MGILKKIFSYKKKTPGKLHLTVVDILIKHTCEDTAEYCYRWYYALHVITKIFLAYKTMNAKKNVYLFSANGATIYVDLDDGLIVNDPNEVIIVDSIIQWNGRIKTVDFKFRYNNREFTWRYRYTKVRNSSEIYLVGRRRTDPISSNLVRGANVSITYDNVMFICEWKGRIPVGLHRINGANIIVIKNEEPGDSDDDE